MALKYTTVSGFWSFLGIAQHILDFAIGEEPKWEDVGNGNSAQTIFYLDRLGVNEDTLVLKKSSDDSTFPSTAYVFDSDRSKITLTAGGVTLLATSGIQASYEYNTLGSSLKFNETASILGRAEHYIEEECDTVFADQTSTAPEYFQITNEGLVGKGTSQDIYNTNMYPIVKLQSSISTAYVTGSTAMQITSASGFPSTGTIYVGENKVTYTAKSSNTLTVPSTTPSIAADAVVRGEVVEVSLDPGGVTPSYTILVPDVDYAIDYDSGQIQLLDDYYVQNLYSITRPSDGTADRVRISYMNAYHPIGDACMIPPDIVEAMYLRAAAVLTDSTIFKANINISDNFNPSTIRDANERISKITEKYKIVRASKV